MGAAERAKGVRAERAVVTWLRTHGWPHAERAVRTGYTTTSRDSADPGDVIGTPGIVWQITDRGDIDQDAVLTRRLADTEAQRAAAHADIGVLVAKRRGVATPGRWWAWVPAIVISLDALGNVGIENVHDDWHAPVRLELAALTRLLGHFGYGGTATEDAA